MIEPDRKKTVTDHTAEKLLPNVKKLSSTVIEMRLFQVTWLLPIVLACAGSAFAGFDTAYEWKYIDYTWSSEEQKQAAVECGQYNPSRIILQDVQPLLDGRVVVTTPRSFDNPASVSVISSETGDGGPLLSPYPDWSWHKKAGDCSGITNAGRTRLDKSGRLWIVDSGKIASIQYCPAKILVFDSTSDELLDEIEIPSELTHNPNDPSKGFLEVQTIESEEDTYVYIADVKGGGLVIFNYETKDFRRIDNQIFAPTSDGTIFLVDGVNVPVERGLGSMILIPSEIISEKTALLKPMASFSAYGISRNDLQKPDTQGKVRYYKTNFTAPAQELERDISKDGIIVAGFPNFLACWNTQHPLVAPNVVILLQDGNLVKFVPGVRITDVIQNGNKVEKAWVLSVDIVKFIKGTFNLGDVNYRLLTGNVDELVKGTNCEHISPAPVADSPAEKTFFPYEA